ncbi:armadillo-type protein [Paraphysoderma sedebokerense]|nr:armadillo-type protein [Paraphysoderma sedebokerense]
MTSTSESATNIAESTPTISDAQLRYQTERRQRLLNLRDHNINPDHDFNSKSLDSSLKKNLSFVKKLRNITADSLPQIIKDFKSLKIEKYLHECGAAIFENFSPTRKFTSADIEAIVEVVSLFHQRFPDDFTAGFVEQLTKLLSPPVLQSSTQEQQEKEEKDRIGRQKGLLRLFSELYLVGLLNSAGTSNLQSRKPAASSPAARADTLFTNVLSRLFTSDGQHLNIGLVIVFVRYYGADICSFVPDKNVVEEKISEGGATETAFHAELAYGIPPEVRKELRSVINQYFDTIIQRLKAEFKAMKKLEHKNNEWYFQKGYEAPEDVKQAYEKSKKSFEKIQSQAQIIADSIQKTLPVLEEEKEAVQSAPMISSLSHPQLSEGKDFEMGIWIDEDEKSFYESLIDLKNLVPGMLLENQVPAKNEIPSDGQDKTAETIKTEDADDEDEDDDVDEHDGDGDNSQVLQSEQTTEEGQATFQVNNVALDGLLAKLPNLSNRDLIDQIAVEFCYLNSKAARNRLIRTLLDIPKHRHDIIPYYCRLIATLGKYYTDISQTIVTHLEKEFRRFVRQKKEGRYREDIMEPKIRNVRYLSELVKFRIASSASVFYCLKRLTDEFTPTHIETLCHLLECCGRFLYHSPESTARLVGILEIIQKKAKATVLDSRLKLMLENAYFQCVPSERNVKKEKVRSEVELYTQWLLFHKLTRRNVDAILKSLLKLPWDQDDVMTFTLRMFRKIWKVKYSNIHSFALLASGLSKYIPSLGVALVDAILEEIIVGLEKNIFKHNQRRIATLKYLGEIYNYRLAGSALIFEVLYLILTFGHPNGIPMPDTEIQLDSPNDFFRIRLCCTLLDTCGICFDRGSSKRKLDVFLTFFQMYIFTKDKLPMDVEYLVDDTFELLRPKMKRFETYEEAVEAVEKIRQEDLKKLQDGKPVDAGDGDSDEEVEEEEVGSEGEVRSDGEEGDEVEDDDDAEEDDESSENDDSSHDSQSDEEHLVVHGVGHHDVSKEDDEEFERQLKLMMVEGVESRKTERKITNLDVPIPKLKNFSELQQKTEDGDKMLFSLVTRKGNKPQVKAVEVPLDSTLAIRTRTQQEKQQEEKDQLKKLVLDYERKEQMAALQSQTNKESEGNFKKGKKVLVLGGSGGTAHQGQRRWRGGGKK